MTVTARAKGTLSIPSEITWIAAEVAGGLQPAGGAIPVVSARAGEARPEGQGRWGLD